MSKLASFVDYKTAKAIAAIANSVSTKKAHTLSNGRVLAPIKGKK